MFLPMSDYEFVRFEKSTRPKKKYDAFFTNLKTGRIKKLSFGDPAYQQFKDTTGLGLYSHLDHGDKYRKMAYHKRHLKDIEPEMWSPGYLSMRYLW